MNYAIASPIQYTLLNSVASKTDLANQLIACFEAVGWTVSANITGGKTLLGSSPEGYSVLLDIFAFSGGNGVVVQLHSAVGSGASGFEHFLGYNATYTWQIIVHPCGFAISPPGLSFVPLPLGAAGSSIFGGIPFIGSNCGVKGATVTEAWFSFGDTDGSIFLDSCPRLNLDVGNHHARALQGCYNGALSINPAIQAWNAIEVLRVSSAALDGTSGGASHPYWYGEQDLLYPAFIAWPLAGADQPINIIGQIYNAAVRSSPAHVDVLGNWDGASWMAYTVDYFFGTLWLMTKAPTPASAPQNVSF